MKLNPKANLLVPDQKMGPEAFSRTTHLGIGAHQDDLEFMAYEGILACYDRADQWFGGVIMTDGRSSSRKGPYAGWTDDQIAAERVKEQHQAAIIGQYSFIAQLGYLSKEVRPAQQPDVVADLRAILLAARSFKAADLYAGVVLLGAIGFASNALLAQAERRLLRWQHP